jgi:RNA polymerase sigma-70 factor (ECF subfamily)
MKQDGLAEESLDLQALKAGDRAEFARLVEMHSPLVYRLALRMMGDPQDAEDVLQETFLKAHRHLGGFDGRARLSTWLYRIAANEALMTLRRRKPEPLSIEQSVAIDGEELPEPVQIVDWTRLPEAELTSAEAAQVLNQAIEALPDSLRMVFLLREMEGLSTLEAAEVLNLSEAAVKTRLSRARLRLRELLSGYYSERLTGEVYGA